MKARTNQSMFGRRVLASFWNRRYVTGMASDKLLVTSHIKPWAVCVSDCVWQRTDQGNVLCLNSLHDRTFGMGSYPCDSYHVELSPDIEHYVDDVFLGGILNLLRSSNLFLTDFSHVSVA